MKDTQREPSGVPTTLALRAYQAGTWLAGPFIGAILKARARAGKEDPARLPERYGRASTPRPEGPLIWLHGASVGESLMLVTLLEALAAHRPDLRFVVTTHTLTSASLMASRLPAAATHQFVPLDRPAWAERFVSHWQPDLAVFAESELWPNLIRAAKSHGARLALINARMTARSLAGWRRWPGAARALLSAFDLIGAADEPTAAGLEHLAGRSVARHGNLKAAAPPPPADDEALRALKHALATRPVWLAASTHPGEEPLMFQAQARLNAEAARAGTRKPVLIVVPRHPDRGKAVALEAKTAGLACVQRSADSAPHVLERLEDGGVYLADTLGEMGLWMRLAHTAVMGGSFVEGIGGHNPLEPALLGTAIITGPHTFNFASVYAQLLSQRGALLAQDADLIAACVRALADEEKTRVAQVGAARGVADGGRAVLDGVLGDLVPLLPEAVHARA